MNLTELTAISPIDGRYRSKTGDLAQYFSEFALIRARVEVEIEYLIALAQSGLPEFKDFPKEKISPLRMVVEDFSIDDAVEIKAIEARINHDVKAVEYFVKEEVAGLALGQWREFVHFGLTSQDINNTAVPLLLKRFKEDLLVPHFEEFRNALLVRATEWKAIPMLARTHGQPASPTGLGKEMAVFAERVLVQLDQLEPLALTGKFGGATGNFNAHFAAYPDVDWIEFANKFYEHLGLERQRITTQIEHYDQLAALLDAVRRLNTIGINFCRDVWTYISIEYFTQEINPDEVGSSAMPHKVNPIDFENAEGNFGVANALFEHLSAKLPISRLQRDLTDSTVLRNVGVPFAHTMLALNSLGKGMGKLSVNEGTIRADLEKNWMVVAEGIQTILRKAGVENPYEQLKSLTRKGEAINADGIALFIQGLDVSDSVKDQLQALNPFNYTGNALRWDE